MWNKRDHERKRLGAVGPFGVGMDGPETGVGAQRKRSAGTRLWGAREHFTETHCGLRFCF